MIERLSEEVTTPIAHGFRQLPSVTVTGYNAELRDGDGFLGDKASNSAFRAILDEWRDRLKQVGDDPLGEKPTAELSKKKLDKVLVEGEPEAAGVIHGAIEQFATDLTKVISKFCQLKTWRSTERIVIGGGLRASRVGELVIGRAAVLLKSAGRTVQLDPIHHHPDAGGLIGAVHLVPAWMLEGHEGVVAVDIGGSNIRAGIVKLNLKKNGDLSGSAVHESEIWRYADEKPTRDAAVAKIGEMLKKLVRVAEKDELKLAPFVGIACPGIIAPDGHIERGGQNLPGNWESSRLNLPDRVRELLPKIGKHETTVVMHNDAVVQGLSELPFIREVEHWGVLTIGTGLGNATFTSRRPR